MLDKERLRQPLNEQFSQAAKPSRKIKIFRVIARLNIGGPAIHVLNLSSGLDSDRFETVLIAGRVGPSEGDMSYLAEALGVTPVVFPELGREISPVRDVKSMFKLWRMIRRHRPDIVHTHTAKAGTVGRIAAALAGVPIVIHTFHGHVFHSYFSRLKSWCFMAIEMGLTLLTTRIITISPHQQEEIAACIYAERKIEVIRLGFDLSKFLRPFDKEAALKRLGLPSGKEIIGCVGRLTAVKNLALFVEVAETLSQRREDALFVVVGDGSEREMLQNMVRDKGLQDRVLFLGWQTEIETVYKAIDLLVLTSKNEGTPVAVIEAMASGCPVVAAPVGGVVDLIEHGVTGFLADIEDSGDFVKKVEQILERPELRQRLAEGAREFVTSHYDLSRLFDDMSRLYIGLVSAAKGF